MAKFNWDYFRETHNFTQTYHFGDYTLYETEWYYYTPNTFTNIPSYINTPDGYVIELPNDTDKFAYKYCFKNFVLYKNGSKVTAKSDYVSFFTDYFKSINLAPIYNESSSQRFEMVFNGTVPDVPKFNEYKIKEEQFPVPVFTEFQTWKYLNNERVYNLGYLNSSTDSTTYMDSDNIYIGDRTAAIDLQTTNNIPSNCTVPLWIPTQQVDTPAVSCGSIRIGYQAVTVPFFMIGASDDNFKYLGYYFVMGIEQFGG